MKHDPLLGALPIIAKALGRRLGVEVVIGARREASTDGQTIHLPPLPAASAPLAVLANGFIDHEAAHVRYTDFAVAKPAGLAGLLANLLEDIRVERALGAAYPGSRRNLAALVDHLESHEPAVPPPDAPVVRQVLGALLYLLRARLAGPDGAGGGRGGAGSAPGRAAAGRRGGQAAGAGLRGASRGLDRRGHRAGRTHRGDAAGGSATAAATPFATALERSGRESAVAVRRSVRGATAGLR